MSNSFVQHGNVMTQTPAVDVAAGAVHFFADGLFGVALNDVSANKAGAFGTVGVWDIAKASGIEIAAGESVYWDATAKRATNVSGNYIGIATASAVALASAVTVKLAPSGNFVSSKTNQVSGVIKILMPDGTYVSIPKQSDAGLDFVASGLTLPSSGTIGVASIAAGVAYVSGYRITHAGSVLALGATKDNYIDLDYDGNIVVSQVAVAAGAPAVAANAIRLGYCRTNATSVTARTTGAEDSNGVWMGNTVSMPHCRLLYSGTFSVGVGDTTFVFGSGTTQYDNDLMHSEVTNNTRVTAQRSGLYRVSAVAILTAYTAAQNFGVKIYKNGASAGLGTITGSADKVLSLGCNGDIALAVGDYLTLVVAIQTSGTTCAAGTLNVSKIG